MPIEGEPKLLLLDGHAMVYRAWFAIQNPLTVRASGEEVRGIFGFMQMLRKAIENYKPDYVALTLDSPTATWRHVEFPAYKAQRRKMPDEFHRQFSHLRSLMKAFRIPVFELDGYEADDLMATLSSQAEGKKINSLILTGDTDLLQLVSPLTRVLLQYRIAEQLTFDEDRVRERYGGLDPLQLVHLKALKGDPSDNIPGVPGIGEKTATKLVKEFGSVGGILENLTSVPIKQRELFDRYRQEALQGVRLITIDRCAPIKLDLDLCRWGIYDRSEVVAELRAVEFFTFVNWVPDGAQVTDGSRTTGQVSRAPEIECKYETVVTEQALELLLETLETSGGFSFDTETAPSQPGSRTVDPMQSRLVGISFSTEAGMAWYIPVGHAAGMQLDQELVLNRLKSVFVNPNVPKAAHNANYDMTVLGACGLILPNISFDTLVGAHLAGRKSIGLKNLVFELLGIEMTQINDLIGSGKGQITMDQVPIDQVSSYACADADMTYRLWGILEQDLAADGLNKELTRVEMALTPVLVAMQLQGINLNVPLLESMGDKIGRHIGQLVERAYELVGHSFNLGSPSQVGSLLFEELGQGQHFVWGKPKRTKTGGYSTDASVLESLMGSPGHHPVIDLISEHRQLNKLKSTYTDALPTMVHPSTGRVHTKYHQAGSVTGRLSSNDPNLQNIPIRTDIGRQIRTAFIPSQLSWSFLGADYSQIELRVLAHLSQDEGLLRAFQNDLDIHSATAAEIFGVNLASVSTDQRRLAKTLNFGIIYGLSPYGISQQTELTVEEGQRFIESYFNRYPGIRQYIEKTKLYARETGYVETVMGRRRYTPEIESSNGNLRQAAEREAVNTPIQGTAAEIMKVAQIAVFGELIRVGLKSKMLLQVHDELIFESPSDEIETLKSIVLQTMSQAVEISVPLKVMVKIGENWGELE